MINNVKTIFLKRYIFYFDMLKKNILIMLNIKWYTNYYYVKKILKISFYNINVNRSENNIFFNYNMSNKI